MGTRTVPAPPSTRGSSSFRRKPESIFALVFDLSPGRPLSQPGKMRTPPYISASSVPDSGAAFLSRESESNTKTKAKIIKWIPAFAGMTNKGEGQSQAKRGFFNSPDKRGLKGYPGKGAFSTASPRLCLTRQLPAFAVMGLVENSCRMAKRPGAFNESEFPKNSIKLDKFTGFFCKFLKLNS